MNFNIDIKSTALGAICVGAGYLLVKATTEIIKAREAEKRIKEVNSVIEKDLEKYNRI